MNELSAEWLEALASNRADAKAILDFENIYWAPRKKIVVNICLLFVGSNSCAKQDRHFYKF
jgi:hypothetical protein